MRLFIAVNFSGEIKERLAETVRRLEAHALKGGFTRKENLHLTLVFIGETGSLMDVKRAMESVRSPAFELSLEGFGRFKRGGGDIYWIGVAQNSRLAAVYGELYDALVQRGFNIDKREFKPHLTLGRSVLLPEGFDYDGFEKQVPAINVQVERISLMKSERVNGRLTYTEIYAKELGGHPR